MCQKNAENVLKYLSFTILIRITGSLKHFAPQLNNLKRISLKIIVQQNQSRMLQKKMYSRAHIIYQRNQKNFNVFLFVSILFTK
jgi:hypothetical protein